MFYLKMNESSLLHIEFPKYSVIRGPNSLIITLHVVFESLFLHEGGVKQCESLSTYVVFRALSIETIFRGNGEVLLGQMMLKPHFSIIFMRYTSLEFLFLYERSVKQCESLSVYVTFHALSICNV